MKVTKSDTNNSLEFIAITTANNKPYNLAYCWIPSWPLRIRNGRLKSYNIQGISDDNPRQWLVQLALGWTCKEQGQWALQTRTLSNECSLLKIYPTKMDQDWMCGIIVRTHNYIPVLQSLTYQLYQYCSLLLIHPFEYMPFPCSSPKFLHRYVPLI